jgi:hypothetical protein
MRAAVFVCLLSFSVLTAGCKTSCRQLSEKVCDCTSSQTERSSCLQAASTKEMAGVTLTPEDEARCEGLLPQCDCRLLDTAMGKVKCGYAVGNDGGQ